MKRLTKWLAIYPRYRWSRYDVLVQRGIIATVVFLFLVFLLSLKQTCVGSASVKVCGNKAYLLLSAPPNEVGDALAGIAGALAFMWIIVTVMLQSKELAAQRQELRLTRRESAKMAEALAAQAEIFKDEQRRRSEERALELLDQQIQRAIQIIENNKKELGFYEEGETTISEVLSNETVTDSGEANFFHSFERSCLERIDSLNSRKRLPVIQYPAKDRKFFDDLQLLFNLIEENRSNLSLGQDQRVDNLRINSISRLLSEILKFDKGE